MTSETDNTPRRRPPTIDLTATEVEADWPASHHVHDSEASKPAAADTQSRPDGRLGQHTLGAVAGAIVTAAIVVGLWFAGYVPSRQPAPTPVSAPPPNAASIATISARLDTIEAELHAQQPQAGLSARLTAAEAATKSLDARLAAAQAATKSLGDSLAALTSHVDQVATAAQGALAQANAASSAADAAKNSAQSSVSHAELDALAGRMTALEGAMKTLSADVTRQASSMDDRAARLTVAADALDAAVERGVPYQAELAAVKALGVDHAATVPLESSTATGVPSASELAHELSLLEPALTKAAGGASADNSYLGRLEARAQTLVHVTPINAPRGDQAGDLVARITAAAARADIDAALADIATLPDAAKSIAAPWVKKAEARNAALAASRRIAAGALAALSAPSPQ
jgi:hypothetical protein